MSVFVNEIINSFSNPYTFYKTISVEIISIKVKFNESVLVIFGGYGHNIYIVRETMSLSGISFMYSPMTIF